MNPKLGRTIAFVLALAAAGLLAAAGVQWKRGGEYIAAWRAKRTESEAELKTTRTELHAHSLRYQAFQKSIPEIPDSLRLSTGGVIREEGRVYEKAIRKLENAETDIKLDLARIKRKDAEATAARKARTLPLAAGGAGALVCAALVAILSRGRPNPA